MTCDFQHPNPRSPQEAEEVVHSVLNKSLSMIQGKPRFLDHRPMRKCPRKPVERASIWLRERVPNGQPELKPSSLEFRLSKWVHPISGFCALSLGVRSLGVGQGTQAQAYWLAYLVPGFAPNIQGFITLNQGSKEIFLSVLTESPKREKIALHATRQRSPTPPLLHPPQPPYHPAEEGRKSWVIDGVSCWSSIWIQRSLCK